VKFAKRTRNHVKSASIGILNSELRTYTSQFNQDASPTNILIYFIEYNRIFSSLVINICISITENGHHIKRLDEDRQMKRITRHRVQHLQTKEERQERKEMQPLYEQPPSPQGCCSAGNETTYPPLSESSYPQETAMNKRPP